MAAGSDLGPGDVADAPHLAAGGRATVDDLRQHLEACDLGHRSCPQCFFAAGGFLSLTQKVP